jgi:fermentation-respiration switch protein FrsA (DUF1100 family)
MVVVVTTLAMFTAPLPARSQTDGSPLRPLGLTCTPTQGVRFCAGNGTTERVPSWDGTPIDADMTLPPTGSGPWPVIVLLHGLGGDKTQLQVNVPPEGGLAPRVLPNREHYNNLFYAGRGYAVLALSLRGFGNSCGGGGLPLSLLQSAPCAEGFIRLADTRYEARDIQHLLGLLVDQGIAEPRRLGATGFSYGGGIAVELAYLKDRIRLPGGEFAPWTSPGGVPMSTGAAYGQWLWSDLIASLLPNGRFLDFDPSTNGSGLEPLGVMSQSYVHGLYGLLASEGYPVGPQPPGGPNEPWDLTTAVALLDLGEPYGKRVGEIAREFHAFHGGYGIPGEPAPLLLESGWSDDLFPVSESLRVYNDLRSRYADPPVAMLLGDLGHGRNGNKPGVSLAFNDLAAAFFDEHLQGRGRGPRPGSVTAYTTTCPSSGAGAAPDGGPFTAGSWEAIHPGRVELRARRPQTVLSTGGDPFVGPQFDPIPQTNPFGAPDPCKSIRTPELPGTAGVAAPSEGLTLLGRPTIRAAITTKGPHGQLVGRLWDVAPDGSQRLVTLGVYRLAADQTGPITWQLNGNGYHFAPGHVVELELAASHAPTYRRSNGGFAVVIRDLVAELPTS